MTPRNPPARAPQPRGRRCRRRRVPPRARDDRACCPRWLRARSVARRRGVGRGDDRQRQLRELRREILVLARERGLGDRGLAADLARRRLGNLLHVVRQIAEALVEHVRGDVAVEHDAADQREADARARPARGRGTRTTGSACAARARAAAPVARDRDDDEPRDRDDQRERDDLAEARRQQLRQLDELAATMKSSEQSGREQEQHGPERAAPEIGRGGNVTGFGKLQSA